jgi:hypothetical protein
MAQVEINIWFYAKDDEEVQVDYINKAIII